MKLLSEDKVEVPVGVDEDKNIIMRNLKDVVSLESYEKFKDYAEKISQRKKNILGEYGYISEEEADQIAREQQTNHDRIEGIFDDIDQLKKDKKATDRVLTTLELLDVMDDMGPEKLATKEKKKYEDKGRQELMASLKNPASSFDEWGRDSALAVGIQAMKNDGKIGGEAWGDDMSVVMIRDFYTMLKENSIDPRANDSGSREGAKKLASKAIQNTIEMVAGGYDQRDKFNSVFLYGRKVSKQPIKKEEKSGYVNSDYIIKNGTKQYTETGINLIPFESNK